MTRIGIGTVPNTCWHQALEQSRFAGCCGDQSSTTKSSTRQFIGWKCANEKNVVTQACAVELVRGMNCGFGSLAQQQRPVAARPERNELRVDAVFQISRAGVRWSFVYSAGSTLSTITLEFVQRTHSSLTLERFFESLAEQVTGWFNHLLYHLELMEPAVALGLAGDDDYHFSRPSASILLHRLLASPVRIRPASRWPDSPNGIETIPI